MGVFTLRSGHCDLRLVSGSSHLRKVSCYDQDGSECASSLLVNPTDTTLLQVMEEFQGLLGESVILMLPSGIVLGLDDDDRKLDEVLDMLAQSEETLRDDIF